MWKVVKSGRTKGYELQVVDGGAYKVQMTTRVPPSLEVNVLLFFFFVLILSLESFGSLCFF